jgi:membrane protein DedA with SNARE-associated domain
VQHFLSSWGYLALVVLTFAEAACVPIPSEVTLGYAGFLASTGKLQIAAVILLASLGEFAGSFVGWSIGRFGGRPLVDKLGRYVLLTHADLDRAERWFRRRGEPAVFFGRILPVVRTFISIPAGVAEMGLLRFGIATLAGSAIWCTAIALTGYELGGQWTKMTKGFSAAGYVLVAVVVVGLAAFVLHRLSAVRRERDATRR